MRKLLLILAVSTVAVGWATPAPASAVRDAGASCAYGAGLLAATTFFGLTPVLGAGILALPTTSAIAQNAVVGCAIGAAGATATHLFTWIYDTLFW